MLQMGLGEFLLKAATNAFSLIGILIVVWIAREYFRRAEVTNASRPESPAMTPIPDGMTLASISPSDLAAADS